LDTAFLQRFMEKAKEWWGTPLGKILTLVAGSVLVAGILLGVLSRKPQMETLGTFDPQQAPQVVAKLREKKIDFAQTGVGYTIQVKQQDLNAARLALAEAGLTEDITWTSVPWQTKSAWNATEMDKRINYKQLVEEELARAIRTMAKVQNAKVIISLPEKTLYARDEKPPKASVVLQPLPREELTPDEVRGIMMMVSSAVDGLVPQNVIVLDATRNRQISDKAVTAEPDPTQKAVDAFRIEQQYQQVWERRLTERLEQVVGVGNVSVIVHVALDWDTLRTEALTYGDNRPLSTQETRRSAEGAGGGGGGQAAGTDPNTANPATYRGGGDGGTFSSEESTRIINYLVSEERTTTERIPGAVKEISAAVFVNQAKIDAAQAGRLRQLVEAAIGSKAGKVDVEAMQFDATLADLLAPPEQPPAPKRNLIWLGVGVGAALAAGLFAFMALRRRRIEELQPLPGLEEIEPVTVAEMEAAAEAERPIKIPQTLEELAQMPPEEVALLGDEFLEKLGVDPVKLRIRERVERLARQNPEAVANLLKTWIAEE
jgi:flagellar M-ring protein FliF